MLYIDCKLVSVMFDRWKSTAEEITGLHILTAISSYSFQSCDNVGVCYYTVVIINDAFMNERH